MVDTILIKARVLGVHTHGELGAAKQLFRLKVSGGSGTQNKVTPITRHVRVLWRVAFVTSSVWSEWWPGTPCATACLSHGKSVCAGAPPQGGGRGGRVPPFLRVRGIIPPFSGK